MDILIIEDDPSINSMLTQYLSGEGFNVHSAQDGPTGLSLALTRSIDLCIIDVMLPDMNGFDVVKGIRQKRMTPIIMLTARTEEIDRILGLEIGADDYMTKPFSARELVARIRALLRRSDITANATKSPDEYSINQLKLYPKKRKVLVNNQPINLTSAEFNILLCLAEHCGDVVEKHRLCEVALGKKLTHFDRSIDMHMSNLRKKLGDSVDIQTVRGAGYVLSQA